MKQAFLKLFLRFSQLHLHQRHFSCCNLKKFPFSDEISSVPLQIMSASFKSQERVHYQVVMESILTHSDSCSFCSMRCELVWRFKKCHLNSTTVTMFVVFDRKRSFHFNGNRHRRWCHADSSRWIQGEGGKWAFSLIRVYAFFTKTNIKKGNNQKSIRAGEIVIVVKCVVVLTIKAREDSWR